MDAQIRAKVTSRLDYSGRSRPGSPAKGISLSPPPIIRAKAKVNSSANIAARKPGAISAPGSVAKVNVGSSLPRSPSPFKPAHTRPATNSPSVSTFKTKVSAASRPHSVISGHSPDSRPRALTSTTNGSLSPPTGPTRMRRGSVSSTLTAPPITRSHLSSPSASKFSVPSPNDDSNGGSNVRVRSKVSRLADHVPGLPASLPSSPSLLAHRTSRPISTSNIKFTPALITSNMTATASSPSSPTSAHYRFSSTREVHSPRHANVFQAFTSNDDHTVSYTSNKSTDAKVDPVSIPLPPQSPPASSVSFSSRSSASKSSVSYGSEVRNSEGSSSTAPVPHSKVNGKSNGHAHDRLAASPPIRSNMNGLGIRLEVSTSEGGSDLSPSMDSFDSDSAHGRDGSYEPDFDDEPDTDRQRKREAKSIRKIADLEITNRSLLAINSSLEATKHRQAKEIRDLRRKLRESRLILPPSAYKAVTSSIVEDDTVETEEAEEEDEEEQAVIEGKTDETYRRVRSLLEGLIEQGRRALETTPDDLAASGKGGAKVLHEVEARTWRGDDPETHSIISRDDVDDQTHLDVDHASLTSRPLSPSRIAVPDDDDGLGSEDEVEATLLEPDTDDIPSAPIPPITVTHP